MNKLLIATHNQGKLKLFKILLADAPYELVSLSDLGISYDVPETGSTYAENATLKATTYAQLSGLTAIADDAGLEVDALNGAPGLYSARWAGENKTDAERIAFLLTQLKDIPQDQWRATFRSTIACATPNGEVKLFTGELDGMIIDTPRGDKGFGYCPIFFVPALNKTYGEFEFEDKVRYGHRVGACQQLVAFLKTTL